MTIDGQIALKKSEADEVWSDYLETRLAAERNRTKTHEVREAEFNKIRAGQCPDPGELLLLRDLEKAQPRLDARQSECAARCDRIGDELAGLQQEREAMSQEAKSSK